MNFYTTTDLGLKILEKNNILPKIENKWKEVESKLIYASHWLEEEDFEDAEKTNSNNSERLNYLERLREKDTSREEFFIASGELVDMIFDKDEQKNYMDKTGLTQTDFDGLVTSYCLEKRNDGMSSRGYYIWRKNGFKTSIYGDTHGDLHVHQLITGHDTGKTNSVKENQLFGELPGGHINADYSFWLHLTALALKYAETVGVDIPETKNIEEVMKKYDRYGWDGTVSRPNSWGVSYEMFAANYTRETIAQLPDKTKVTEVKKRFMGEMCPNADRDVNYLPIIDKDDTLMMCVKRESKQQILDPGIKLEPYGTKQAIYYPLVFIPKESASDLFIGTINGIMSGQSRTRPEFLAYMMWEHEEIKKGKDWETIHIEAADKFGKI